MIQINCTNCKSLLQIDDAFAGGVCRCRHCGTIQTVPKRLKTASTVGVGETSVNEPPSFTPANKRGVADTFGPSGSGTGLDDLAGIVASSGLTSSRLQKKNPPAAEKTPAARWDRKIVAIVASAGAVILILLGVIIFMAVHDGSADTGNDNPPVVVNVPKTDTPPPPDPVVPKSNGGGNSSNDAGNVIPPQAKLSQFLGEPINEMTVVYVIDRGSSSGESNRLDLTKAAVLRSLQSLGPTRRFQLVFWTGPRGDPAAFPKSGPTLATPQNMANAQTFLDEEIYPHLATDASAALRKAFKAKPDVVLLVPIKGISPDQSAFASEVLDIRKAANSEAKIHGFSLEQPGWDVGLERITGVTGGHYSKVSLDKLRQYAGQ